jgi:hypothetical protein
MPVGRRSARLREQNWRDPDRFTGGLGKGLGDFEIFMRWRTDLDGLKGWVIGIFGIWG